MDSKNSQSWNQLLKDLEPVRANQPIPIPAMAIPNSWAYQMIVLCKALDIHCIGIVWEQFRPASWDSHGELSIEFKVPVWKDPAEYYWWIQFPNRIFEFYRLIDSATSKEKVDVLKHLHYIDWSWGTEVILMHIIPRGK